LCYNGADNKVYCANSGSLPSFDSTVSVINGSTNEVTTTLAVGYAPSVLCYQPASNRIFCASDFSSDVAVIDGHTDEVLLTIKVGRTPASVVCNPIHGRVYVANYNESSISVLRDSGGGVEESFKPQAPSQEPTPTITRGVLFLPEAQSLKLQTANLMDAAGRVVMNLLPGANDVRALAPGVYFIRGPKTEDGRPGAAVRKVVLTR
jgi:YVTN family beta-propeller protein